MQLYDGVYRIESLYGDRNLFQYLFVGRKTLLLDTGIAETPRQVIFPAMDRLGLRPETLTLAITTHSDLDHQGGNSSIKRISPGTWLGCGLGDRSLIENPRRLYDERYNAYKSEHDLSLDPEPPVEAGQACKMDICFTGGETILLDDDWELKVLHVPGHSHGHLAIFDAKHRVAFAGDAIQGRGCPKAEGGFSIPVTYYYVDAYLSTLRYFEGLDIEVLHTGHWPPKCGEEVRDFIAESRETVELIDRIIIRNLQNHPSGLSLAQLVDAVANAVGDWPPDWQILAMFPIKGHLDRFENHLKVRAERETRPTRYLTI